MGFIVDLLSHATIIGFMGGAATVVILQQLKGMLGLDRFTTATDIISVMESVFSQTHQVHITYLHAAPIPSKFKHAQHTDGP